MPLAGMEPPVAASEWPQTHALDRADVGVGFSLLHSPKICRLQSVSEKDGRFMKHSVVTDCTRFSSPDGKFFFFFNISFYCTTSLITDYKYTYVTINGL